MRLRKPCEDDLYDAHYYDEPDVSISLRSNLPCPGGEFLPVDALVVEKVEGEWPDWASKVAYEWSVGDDGTNGLFDALASAELSDTDRLKAAPNGESP